MFFVHNGRRTASVHIQYTAMQRIDRTDLCRSCCAGSRCKSRLAGDAGWSTTVLSHIALYDATLCRFLSRHSIEGRSFYATPYSASNHLDLHHNVHTQHTCTMSLEYKYFQTIPLAFITPLFPLFTSGTTTTTTTNLR
jgi:hypothetical protein